jgi:hypothetical protein
MLGPDEQQHRPVRLKVNLAPETIAQLRDFAAAQGPSRVQVLMAAIRARHPGVEPLASGLAQTALTEGRVYVDADRFQAAVMASPEAMEALDEAVEEVAAQRPSLSLEQARRWVLAYVYALALAGILLALLTEPEATALILAASGVSAVSVRQAAAKAWDYLIVAEREPGPEI